MYINNVLHLDEATPHLHNEELFGAVMDFSITHNEVYLEMGIIVGVQMYKNLEQQNYLDLANIQKIIKDTVSADMKRENANE